MDGGIQVVLGSRPTGGGSVSLSVAGEVVEVCSGPVADVLLRFGTPVPSVVESPVVDPLLPRLSEEHEVASRSVQTLIDSTLEEVNRALLGCLPAETKAAAPTLDVARLAAPQVRKSRFEARHSA